MQVPYILALLHTFMRMGKYTVVCLFSIHHCQLPITILPTTGNQMSLPLSCDLCLHPSVLHSRVLESWKGQIFRWPLPPPFVHFHLLIMSPENPDKTLPLLSLPHPLFLCRGNPGDGKLRCGEETTILGSFINDSPIFEVCLISNNFHCLST